MNRKPGRPRLFAEPLSTAERAQRARLNKAQKIANAKDYGNSAAALMGGLTQKLARRAVTFLVVLNLVQRNN